MKFAVNNKSTKTTDEILLKINIILKRRHLWCIFSTVNFEQISNEYNADYKHIFL